MKRQNRRNFIKTSTGIVAGIGIAGCTGGDGGTEQTTTTAGDQETDTPTPSSGATEQTTGGATTLDSSNPFTVGVIQPLSGPYANLGTAQKRGAEMAVEDINANGGFAGRKAEIVAKDSKLSPETGVQAARELNQNGVDVIFGALLSNVGLAIREFVESAQIPMSTPIYSKSAVGGDCNTYTFPISGVDSRILGAAASKSIRNNVDGARIGTVTPDYTIGHETWQSFKEEFTSNKSGATVTEELFPAIGKGDYQNEIQSLISADVDIVQTLLFSQDLITFVKQAKQFDFFQEINAFVLTGTFIDLVESLGEDMVQMYAALPYYNKFPETESNNSFVERFHSTYDAEPHNSAEQGYANTIAFKQAVDEAGGTSADDIVSGLDGLSVQSPGGARDIRPEDNLGINRYIPTGWLSETPDTYTHPYGITDVEPIDGKTIAPPVICS